VNEINNMEQVNRSLAHKDALPTSKAF